MYAPYALRPEESRGRRHPEPPHPYRSDFQRDRDRVIHSRAFRRLHAGHYKVKAIATNSAGQRSQARSLKFKIARAAK